MDQYSAAELTELSLLQLSDADSQFQFWLTITFAAVVASFAAGKKLNLLFRGIAAVLYLLASIMLINRFYRSVDRFGVFSSALRESGIDLYDAGSNLVPSLRLWVFVIGTGAAIFFMVLPQKGLTAKPASTD